jgi:hypothetical protein
MRDRKGTYGRPSLRAMLTTKLVFSGDAHTMTSSSMKDEQQLETGLPADDEATHSADDGPRCKP